MNPLSQVTKVLKNSLDDLECGNVSSSLIDSIDTLVQEMDMWKNSSSQEIKARITNKAFTATMFDLFAKLNRAGDDNFEMVCLLEKVKAIFMKPEMAPNLKYLPYKSDCATTIQIFRNLIAEDVPDCIENFVTWIEYWRLPLSKLQDLSLKDLIELAPHFKYLNINVDTFSEEEVHALIQSSTQIEELHLSTASITTTPVLSDTLKKFVCNYNENLREIISLNDGLKEFRCLMNEKLKTIPELPTSLKECIIEENPSLRI